MSARTPANFSLYRITSSNAVGIDVGQLLIDKGKLLTRVWDFIDMKTGESTGAVGKRVGRLCVECRVKHRKAAPLGHEGEHGPDAPIVQPDDEVTS